MNKRQVKLSKCACLLMGLLILPGPTSPVPGRLCLIQPCVHVLKNLSFILLSRETESACDHSYDCTSVHSSIPIQLNAGLSFFSNAATSLDLISVKKKTVVIHVIIRLKKKTKTIGFYGCFYYLASL